MQSYDPFARRDTKPVTRKEEYEKEYLDSKAHGKSFFPDIIFKDTVAVVLVFLVIIGLAIFRGAPLEAQADPTNTAYAPRPEWYFLFLFEALKYFPGSLEWVAALGLPIVGIGVLVLLPFLDRSRWRHPANRPIVVSIGLLVLAGMAYLTYASATAPTVVGAASGDAGGNLLPIERSGRQVFQDRRCSVCHTVAGIGGKIGPDLTTVGRRLDATALIQHLKQPKQSTSGVVMPDFNLSDPELLELVSYLLSLQKAPPPMTLAQAGKATFNVFCNSCHPGGNAGAGPKISGGDFLKKHPTDATITKIIRGGTPSGMPAFSDTALADEQLSAIVAYLRTLK